MSRSTEAQHKYLMRRRAKARAHLGGRCAKCGTVEGLEFDHIDPAQKVIEIAQAIAQHWAWARLVLELEKCQLLCKTHHLDKSRGEGSFSRPSTRKIINPPHGTWAKYGRDGCRCPDCRQWRKQYKKHLVDARGNKLA